ncbi:MAG: hypothetical protein H7X93_11220 [Sphingomonadaceae bacterium]|nr:hypothetical protein [Sphingomonadaceae bacterium]
MTPLAQAFARDASLLPQMLDLANDRVMLLELTQADYRAASFLDQRAMTQERRRDWAGWAEIEAATPARADADFIFHIGHVGSTLIARLLGELRSVLALREPLILRTLAEIALLRDRPESPWPPQAFMPRLRTATAWLSRTFDPGQRALVKATSFAGELAGDILAQSNRAVFLSVSPERYIETILAGENSRQELTILSGPRLVRLHRRIGAEPWALWQLPEAVRAALGWACEMATLTEAARHAASNQLLWVDFDAFLADPARRLQHIAEFLGHELSRSTADALISGPIMQRYSKAPEHGYSPELRAQLLAQTRRERGGEIGAALDWLEQAASDHPVIADALAAGHGR